MNFKLDKENSDLRQEVEILKYNIHKLKNQNDQTKNNNQEGAETELALN